MSIKVLLPSKRFLSVIPALALSAVLSACSTGEVITSSAFDQGAIAGEIMGPHYFLPKVLVDVTIERKPPAKDASHFTEHFTVGEAQFLPDPSHAYRLRYHRDFVSNDTVVIETTPDGLLKSVNSTTEDESATFVKKLVELAGDVSQVIVAARAREDASSLKPFKLVARVDPSDSKDCDRVNASLASVGAGMTLVCDGPLGKNAALLATNPGSNPEGCAESVCFRPALPYKLSLTGSQGVIVGEAVALVPNRARVIGIDIRRAAFVENHVKLGFEKGMLTKFDLSKPSEAIAFMSIPIDVAKAIVSIPSALFQFKVASVQEDAKLVNAQNELLQSRAALAKNTQLATVQDESATLAAQKALLDAQTQLLQSQSALLSAQQKAEQGEN